MWRAENQGTSSPVTVLHHPQQRVPCREGALDAPISQMGKWRSKAGPRAGSRGDLSSAFSSRARGVARGQVCWGAAREDLHKDHGGGGHGGQRASPLCVQGLALPPAHTAGCRGRAQRQEPRRGLRGQRGARGRVMDSTAIHPQSRRDGCWSDGGRHRPDVQGAEPRADGRPVHGEWMWGSEGGVGRGDWGGQGGEAHTPSKGKTVAL